MSFAAIGLWLFAQGDSHIGEDGDWTTSYWDQVCCDLIHGDTQSYDDPCSKVDSKSAKRYTGKQPSAHASHGPLITTSECKHVLDTVVQTDLEWVRLDHLNRFTVMETSGANRVSVRSLKALFEVDATMAPLVPKWYGSPWFASRRSLSVIRDDLTETCLGLRHLESTNVDVGQHHHAPPTIVITVCTSRRITNWRAQELVCSRAPDGWYFVRTVYHKALRPPLDDSQEGGNMEYCVYFYASLCLFDPDQWTHIDIQSRAKQWHEDTVNLVHHKLDYMLDDLAASEYRMRCLMSNQWMLLRLPE